MMLAQYLVLPDLVKLTGAGYLPPAVVAELAERTSVSDWWIGKANRDTGMGEVGQQRAALLAVADVDPASVMTVPRADLTAATACDTTDRAEVVARDEMKRETIDSFETRGEVLQSVRAERAERDRRLGTRS